MTPTAPQPTMATTATDSTQFQHQTINDQHLQRQIEDTLMLLSAVPDTLGEDKVTIDCGAGGSGLALQHDQLGLFANLEDLVRQLSTERRRTITSGLHPAMSAPERKALEVALKRAALAEMAGATPSEVRNGPSVEQPPGHPVYELASLEQDTDTPAITSVADLNDLDFPALTPSELATRDRELALAKAEAAGVWGPELEVAADTAEAKRLRGLEVATKLAAAARSASLEVPIVQAREGLRFVKVVGAAVRAYTDVSPREVVVVAPAGSRAAGRVGSGEGVERASREETPRVSQETPRASLDETPRVSESLQRVSGQVSRVKTEIGDGPATSPTAQPKQKIVNEPALDLTCPTTPMQLSSLETSGMSSAQRPSSDPSNTATSTTSSSSAMHKRHKTTSGGGGCPWPETFFSSSLHSASSPRMRATASSPRTPAAAVSDRSTSLPQPASLAIRRVLANTPVAPSKPPADTVIASLSPSPVMLKPNAPPPRRVLAVPPPLSPATPTPVPAATNGKDEEESAAARRKGSIAAARAGLEERIRQQQREGVKQNLPYKRVGLRERFTESK